jgi:LacI family transcriptional regulator
MKDVAKELNVSVVTVSKVLRGHSDIGPETRERVLRRVQELDYRPNLAARGLVTGRSYMVGLVVPELKHAFFGEIAAAVGSRIRRKGYRTVIASSEEDPDLEIKSIEAMLAHQVDGLIIASTLTEAQAEVFRRIEKQNVPYVLVDRDIPGLKANFVGVDDEAIGAMATEHLIQRGNRRIAHIRGPETSTGTGRLRGYTNAMARYGLTVPATYVVKVERSDVGGEAGGIQAMQQLLAVDPRPDAVFCHNDLAAIGALRAILSLGMRVPADVALVGVANWPYLDLFGVPLSSIDQNATQIGDRAAKILLKRMEFGPKSRPTRILIPLKLVVRDSSATGPRTAEQAHKIEVPPSTADQVGMAGGAGAGRPSGWDLPVSGMGAEVPEHSTDAPKCSPLPESGR